MIIKNKIPVLEFDTDETAVIMPTHQKLDLNLPKKAVFAFLREHIDEYAKAHNAIQVGKFVSVTKDYPNFFEWKRQFHWRKSSWKMRY